MKIQELADFVALERLARSLWRNGESRGAALLVGAGFSRFANLAAADTSKPPVWNDLRMRMAAEIYSGVPENKIPSDPLRLAEEYQALLGRAAVDDFIRSQVLDHAWEPSETHDELMRLPWSDVLTTNWDSLLERAARSVGEIGYEPVLVESDIARAKSPRIIKLHGNVPTGPFIFTEEDYRTYPVQHAPFVNLARQIFLENELCLIGFSGNDPNFLQWSGWVRDNLGASTRRIYLVGILDLHPATRRLLEARKVAPVDLAPLVEGLDSNHRHIAAIKQLINFLHEAKPVPAYAWTPGVRLDSAPGTPDEFQRRHRDLAYAANLLDGAALQWQAERESYPGWIVCPYEKRSAIRHGTDVTPMPSREILARLNTQRQHRILYELAWRFEVSFWSIPTFLFELFHAVATPMPNSGLSSHEHLTIATILLRTARESGNQEKFNQISQMIEQHSEVASDFRAAVTYQKCLWHRDHLDFANLSNELQQLSGSDPIWGLRRAGLHCELIEYDKANDLIVATLNDLRKRQRQDRKSLWVLSRRAWAQFLDRASDRGFRFAQKEVQSGTRYEDWPLEFKATKSDPWDELRYAEDEIAEAHRKQSETAFDIKPHFDAGTYTEQGEGIQFSSWTVQLPSYGLGRLTDSIGVPVTFAWTSILATAFKNAATLEFEPTEAWYLFLLRILRNHEDPLIDQFLNRVAVAKLANETVSALTERLTNAVAFWRRRTIKTDPSSGRKIFDTRVIEKLRVLIEVLSRLAIRLAPEKARPLYDLALGVVRDADLRHMWLLQPVDHLLQRSGEAMPKELRAELVPSAIEFPIQGEIGMSVPEREWPTPVSHIANCPLRRNAKEAVWSVRIQQLISATRTGDSASRPDAALRLCFLDDARLLSAAEQESFGQALWAQQDPEKHIPNNTHLLAHVFLRVAAPDPDAAARYFTEILFKAPAKDLLTNEASLMAMVGAAAPTAHPSRILRPTRADAIRIFDEMLALKPAHITPPNALGVELQRKGVTRQFGPLLIKSLMPVFEPSDYTDRRIDLLFELIETAIAPSAISALPIVVRIRPEFEEKAINAIRRALVGRKLDEISGGVNAIENWLFPRDDNYRLPESVSEHVVAAIAHRREIGLASLLWCARRLLDADVLPEKQRSILVEAIRDLFNETRYDRIELSNERGISLSFVRVECVKLAKKLFALGTADTAITDWLKVGRTDPLPEVRWALIEDDDPQ
ncbi:SIR2 family protein [Methylovirgula sp. HY1]|uniref:SIR2 family NAD-dependent protein deacylase n=1 Tax=Methylovirgula sp. HY1 TaxID=2822761 RepID=UPI001C5A74DF|nr:SIR2 family protein [Methylovirgula sp. HY1]QXX74608.1 hypothetical protein MHY1_01423 [Methylovirgula sp. HY1]